MLKKSNTFSLIYHWNIFFLVLFACIAPRISVLFIIAFVLVVLIGIIKKQMIWNFSYPLFFLFFLYLIYLFGSFFTNNPSLASHYIESKLSFVLFPFVFSFRLNDQIKLQFPVFGLLLGCLLLAIFGIQHSFLLYSQGNTVSDSFFNVGFSYIHHPSYFVAFLIFSLIAVIFAYKNNWHFFTQKVLVFYFVYTLILSFLCQSFAGILFEVILGFFYLLYLSYKKFDRKHFYLILVSITFGTFSFLYWNLSTKTKDNSEIVHTIESVSDYLKSPGAYIEKYVGYKTGNEERLIMWTATFLEILNHPFGVGTGNIDDHLKERLILLKQDNMLEKEYNPHNQFLQTTLEIGVVGLICLFLFLGFSLRQAFINNNWLLYLLIFNLIFNAFFESMLQRQSGIVFYSFWICLLVVISNKNLDKHEN
jgi:O-antigen ligase